MKLVAFILCLISGLFVVGCSTNNPIVASLGVQPSPATSEFLKTKGGGFYVHFDDNRHIDAYHCGVGFEPTKKLDKALYLEVRFENPVGGAPLVTDAVLQPDMADVFVSSPDLRGLRAHRNYRVDILVFDSAAKSHQIGTHTQYVLCHFKS